jgi:hypothetical protein
MSWSSVGPSVCPLDAIFLLSSCSHCGCCSSRGQGKRLHFANLIPALLSLSPLSAFVLKIPKLPDLPSLCALCLANIYSSLPPLCDSLEDSQQRQNYRTVKKHNNIFASVCWPSCDQVTHLGGGAVAEIVVGDKAVANDDWSPQLLRCILTNKQTSQNFCLCLNTSGR